MNDALWTDIHIAASRHLTILAHAEGIVTLPVVGLGVVGYHHAVGHHDTRSILVRREQAEGVTGVHDQRLFVGHLTEILHHQAVLSPVLEHGAITAVGDQFVRMLSHARIQVVLYHHHDGGSLFTAVRIFVNGTGIHRVGGAQTVHVDTSVLMQLLGKFRCQLCMLFLGEISEGVSQGELLLLGGEDVLALRRMVDIVVVGRHLREY